MRLLLLLNTAPPNPNCWLAGAGENAIDAGDAAIAARSTEAIVARCNDDIDEQWQGERAAMLAMSKTRAAFVLRLLLLLIIEIIKIRWRAQERAKMEWKYGPAY
mmetsp:Transcript_3751/g.7885  ORF Transcript_3751/g.7885 Transcript_3751/m.7885 type:complete len:104 (-) Transcript_3751:46-357(-)